LDGLEAVLVGGLKEDWKFEGFSIGHGLWNGSWISAVNKAGKLDSFLDVSLNPCVVITLVELSHLLFFRVCVKDVRSSGFNKFIKDGVKFDNTYVLCCYRQVQILRVLVDWTSSSISRLFGLSRLAPSRSFEAANISALNHSVFHVPW
jgi:hypothetical protein